MKPSDEMPSYEECFICDDLTGRAGQGEDSLYCDECDKGPYCPDCFRKHHESDGRVAKLKAENEAYKWLIKKLPLRLFDEIADKAPPNIREHFYSDALLTGEDDG